MWELRWVSFISGITFISLILLAPEEVYSRLPSGSLIVSADTDGSSMSEERSTETVSKNAFALNWAASTSADLRDDLFSFEGFVAD